MHVRRLRAFWFLITHTIQFSVVIFFPFLFDFPLFLFKASLFRLTSFSPLQSPAVTSALLHGYLRSWSFLASSTQTQRTLKTPFGHFCMADELVVSMNDILHFPFQASPLFSQTVDSFPLSFKTIADRNFWFSF